MAKKRKTNRQSDLANVRGRQRAEHFASGGTPQMWRGNARTLDNDTKAKRSKEACRGKVDW